MMFILIGRPFLFNFFTSIVWILHLFPTIISVKIRSPTMAIFSLSLFNFFIILSVFFFEGLRALCLYSKPSSLPIVEILFSDGLLLIKYKEKYSLDFFIHCLTFIGMLFVFLLINVPSTSRRRHVMPFEYNSECEIL